MGSPHTAPPGLAQVMFGAGCFWCVEAVFTEVKGVVSVEPGYAGGSVPDPDYRAVCTGTTGHAEVALITYDPALVRFEDLLEVFWMTHDPTTVDRQGHDVGSQYRSVIFAADADQLKVAQLHRDRLDASGLYAAPIVTQILPWTKFYPAENYHRDYYLNNPEQGYCQFVIRPKLEKFRAAFHGRLK